MHASDERGDAGCELEQTTMRRRASCSILIWLRAKSAAAASASARQRALELELELGLAATIPQRSRAPDERHERSLHRARNMSRLSARSDRDHDSARLTSRRRDVSGERNMNENTDSYSIRRVKASWAAERLKNKQTTELDGGERRVCASVCERGGSTAAFELSYPMDRGASLSAARAPIKISSRPS